MGNRSSIGFSLAYYKLKFNRELDSLDEGDTKMGDRFNMGFSLEDIETEAKQIARKMASDRCHEIIRREFHYIFMGPQTTKDSKPGSGYEIIQTKISELLLGENFQTTITNQIEKVFNGYFEKALHEATERAARKLAFTKTPEEINKILSDKYQHIDLQKGAQFTIRTQADPCFGKNTFIVKHYEISEIEELQNGTAHIKLQSIPIECEGD